MSVSPYVMYNGQCEEAFRYYEKHLGGKIKAMMPYAGSPAAKDVPADAGNKILHATITVNGTSIMASDAPAGRYEKPQGLFLSLDIKTGAEAERVFKALSDGGSVIMPLEKTFWAARFGMLADRFGIPWMVNCENED